MKLSTKIILPIILISALLILLAGCFGVPADESPGYTPGTITGIIASPCCSTSAEPVSETCCIAPEYWCFYCQKTWSLQDGIEVALTYGEDEVATVFTNKDGEFTFTNVDPGKNYVVTAYCPDFADNRPLVKDVALELIEGGSFDTKITDLVSTSLGLVVDFLVLYTEWGPEDISLDEVLADRPNFPSFPKFKKLVYEVRRVVENCEVNLLTDDDVQDALCRAAEEISKLDIGCGPGYTPPPPPPPGPCEGNIAPSINSVLLDGTAVSIGETVNVIVNTPYIITINASDDGVKDPLVYYASVDGVKSPATTSNQVTVTPTILGTFEIYAFTHDGCVEEEWGPVTVVVDCHELASLTFDITIPDPLCQDDCAIINFATVSYTDATPDLVIYDLTELDWSYNPAEIDFTPGSGAVCLASAADPGTYTINATYEDECGETVSSLEVDNIPFVLCCPELASLTFDITIPDPLCQDDCAIINFATVSYTDATPDLVIYDLTELDWSYNPAEIDFTPGSGAVCLASAADPGTYTINATYEDECGETVSSLEIDNIPFVLCCPELASLTFDITIPDPLCQDDCAIINFATVSYTDATPDLVIYDLTELDWSYNPAEIDFTPGSGAVCLASAADPGTYTINATYEDECGETVSSLEIDNIPFVLCCPELASLTFDITIPDPLCQDDCAIINFATVSYTDATPDLVIYDLTELDWSYNPAEIDFTPGSGAVCLASAADPGTYTINATYEDECGETVSSLEIDNIPFVLCCPELASLTFDITIPDPLCQDDCAIINFATVSYTDATPDLVIYDLTELDWSYNPAEIDFTPGSGAVCLASAADPGTYTINATYEDECGETVSSLEIDNIPFVDCNVITFFHIRGYHQNSGACSGGLQYEYEVDYPDKSITPDVTWLNNTSSSTPNAKYINFIACYDDPSTIIEYRYRYMLDTTLTWSDEWNTLAWISDQGPTGFGDGCANEFISGCMDAPTQTATPKYYCIAFEIQIRVNYDDLSIYTVHIW